MEESISGLRILIRGLGRKMGFLPFLPFFIDGQFQKSSLSSMKSRLFLSQDGRRRSWGRLYGVDMCKKWFPKAALIVLSNSKI